MRVLCRHGHFAFYPEDTDELAAFGYRYNQTLVRDQDFYTFAFLQSAPRFSINGQSFLNLSAIVNFEGIGPWQVLKENGFVYSLKDKTLVAKESITSLTNPPLIGNAFKAESPLVQPGSRNAAGSRLMSYDGVLDLDWSILVIREFQYE